jgi:uncharacterized protein (UPF0261 family)
MEGTINAMIDAIYEVKGLDRCSKQLIENAALAAIHARMCGMDQETAKQHITSMFEFGVDNHEDMAHVIRKSQEHSDRLTTFRL